MSNIELLNFIALCIISVTFKGMYKIFFSVCFSKFPVAYADLTEKAHKLYETFSELLPICTVVTTVKAMKDYYGTVVLCDSNPYSQSYLTA
jgi:hypothetical protein